MSHKSPLPPEDVTKVIRSTVGCTVRTIPNKKLRLPNGAHGAPYIAFTTPSTGKGSVFWVHREWTPESPADSTLPV